MQGERGGWNEGGADRMRMGWGGKWVKHRTDGSVTHFDSLTF